jgi:hypothetical protein
MTAIPTPKPSWVVEIERLGFGFKEVAQYDLSKLDTSRRVQVRDTSHYAPKDEVERYAIQMAHSEFPPIVVTSDDWITDGNTRAGACEVRGNKFFPAIVLDVEWATATQKRKDELRALAATLNSQNGRALDRKEARAMGRTLVGMGWKSEQIGRALGITAGVVGQVKKEIDAEKKLTKVGLDGNGSLKGASLRALGVQQVLDLNDKPYREVAVLAADAGLNAKEIVALAKEAKAKGSDDDALALITATRAELSERIKDQQLTGKSKPPAARLLRQALGGVVKYAGQELSLVETNPEAIPQHVEMLTTAVAVLQEALRLQERPLSAGMLAEVEAAATA